MLYLNTRGKVPGEICYDINYVLKLCTEQQDQLRKPCVLLHCILGQLDQAAAGRPEDGDTQALYGALGP